MSAPVNPSDLLAGESRPAITRLAQCLDAIQSEKTSRRAPLVSVCISAYNHAQYLGECIDSVLGQTYPSFEIIVIDDASTDGSFDIANEYARLYPGKVQAHRNSENLGPCLSPNRAFKLAKGAYIALLGSDDRMLPERLAKQVQFLQDRPDHVAVMSQIQAIDANGLQNPKLSAFEASFNQPIVDLRGQLIAWNVLNAPSALIRAEALHAIDGYSPLLRYVQDYDLWMRLLEAGNIARLDERLTEYRVHDRNLSVFGGTPPFQARVETAAVILRAARRWPISTWIPAGQESGPQAEGEAQLKLATHLARVDQHFFERPVVTTTYAYELALAAAEREPQRAGELKASLEAWLDGGEAPALVTERMLTALPSKDRQQGAPLRKWLDARVFSAAQTRLVAQRVESSAHRPSIGVAIQAGAHSEAALRTLRSLQQFDPALFPLTVLVTGTGAQKAVLEAGACAFTITVADARAPREQLEAINAFAAGHGFEWLLTVEAGVEFTRSGLAVVLLQLIEADQVRAVYADEMMDDGRGGLSALLRPDFNLDLLLSMPSGMSRHWLVRRTVFLDAGGFDTTCVDATEFELLLRLIDAGGIDGLAHVHEPLLMLPPQEIRTRPSELEAIGRHLRNRGYEHAAVEATLPGCYRIRYGHQATPGVSIIIPTKNQFRMLQRCVESLLEKTTYQNYEVLIVDNGSDESDACTWLDGIEAMDSPQLRVIRFPHPFNYSTMNNLAASQARGEYLVLLNNDTAVLRGDWLDALLNHAQRPEVGIVGAKLLYPDSRIQHAGVVLGLRGPAEHPFIGDSYESPGYMYRLQVDQDYSAVTGACLMVRKSLYDEVGGLDEDAFKVSYNDVDLCLKVRSAGYLVVWTPHAVLLHEGSVSQARVDTSALEAKARRFRGEQEAFYDRWLPVVARDPAYNDNLSLHGTAFQTETDTNFNWNPTPWRPLPVGLALPADRFGCGHYRMLQPARGINEFGLADLRVGDRYYSPVELERLSPDVVVLQRQMLSGQVELQKRMLRLSRSFKVAELDDYLPNLPLKSAHKGQLPSDVLKSMREALKLMDRFVVSTEPLAEALAGLHPDIRIVHNHLPVHWWGSLTSRRGRGQRPRVGWGGGMGHRGDLELIADVVRALANEVEWVFLGMCPEKLRPFVHEFHPGVQIDEYPAKLASLDLDLALAPLEDNLFNRCKSNLRLLEYGACGFPVVCSDVAPYQRGLPVTLVKPRFKDWVEAIRMHVSDLDATAKAGDALRDVVRRDWMLDQKHAAFWLSQWLPG